MFYLFVYHIVAKLIVLPYVRLFNRLEITGLDRIPDDGPAVIIANHVSMWDPVLMYCLVRKRTWFMAKSELFKIPVLSAVLKRICVFPIKRDSIDRTAIRKATQVLEEGCLLIVFPEGHRSRTREMLPFKQGAAMFAHRAKVPVYPVFFDNTRMIFPKSFRKRVRVTFGEPIDLSAFMEEKVNSALLKEMTEEFRKSLELLQEKGLNG